MYNEQDCVSLYLSCYEKAKSKGLPQSYLRFVFNDGEWDYDTLYRFFKTVVGKEIGVNDVYKYADQFYRQLVTEEWSKYDDILRKGLPLDLCEKDYYFLNELHHLFLQAEALYGNDVPRYGEYLSCLTPEEITGNEWWFDYAMKQQDKCVMNNEEKEDAKRLVLKLNNGVFAEDVFDFSFKHITYESLVFLVRSYEYEKNEKLFKSTNRDKILVYKNNQKNTVSRKDVALFSFFRRIGVINSISESKYERKIGMYKNLTFQPAKSNEYYLKKYGETSSFHHS